MFFKHEKNHTDVLTDVVVFSAGAELEAQGEGGEELELLGELERPVGGEWPVALPAFEALGGVVAGAVAVVVDHVEDVALGSVVRHRPHVVRAVHVQVVVDAHVDVVVPAVEPGKRRHRDIYLLTCLRVQSMPCGSLHGRTGPIEIHIH